MMKKSMNNLVTVYGNMSGSQIQQGTNNSTQSMVMKRLFDYDQILDALEKLQNTMKNQGFDKDFGKDAEPVKLIVEETLQLVKQQGEPSKIKKALESIKNIAYGTSGSIIAYGIIELIKQLSI
jgi:hypothetical protein